jgi:hypothetical protein
METTNQRQLSLRLNAEILFFVIYTNSRRKLLMMG